MRLPLMIGLTLLGAASALQARAACYTVYVGNGIVYRSTTTPVDLSRPYSETLPARFGRGASMITSHDDTGCTQVVFSGGEPPEGISRGTSGSRTDRARSGTVRASGAPVSLDGVFLDPSLKMRSSVGVSEPAPSVTKIRRPASAPESVAPRE